jgi:hypothetical protein
VGTIVECIVLGVSEVLGTPNVIRLHCAGLAMSQQWRFVPVVLLRLVSLFYRAQSSRPVHRRRKPCPHSIRRLSQPLALPLDLPILRLIKRSPTLRR